MVINLKSILIATSIAILAACGGSAGNGSVTCTTTDKQTTCVDTSHVSVPGPTLVGNSTLISPATAPEKPATVSTASQTSQPTLQGQQTLQSPVIPRTNCFSTGDANGCPADTRPQTAPPTPPTPCGPAPVPVYLPDGHVDLTSVVGFRQPTC